MFPDRTIRLIQTCIEESFDFPAAGHFNEKDILALITRKNKIQNIEESLFRSLPLSQFLKMNSYWSGEYGNIKTEIRGFKKEDQLKFMRKTDWLLICTCKTDQTQYKLIVPLNSDNVELLLFGVVFLTDSNSMLEWAESILVVTNIENKKENKTHLTLTKSKYSLPLLDRFGMVRLENAALYALSEMNNQRLQYTYRNEPDLLLQVKLLYSWSMMHVIVNTVQAIENKKTLIDSKFRSFSNFQSWSKSIGVSSNQYFHRVDPNLSYIEDNCIWSDWNEDAILTMRYYSLYDKDGSVHYVSHDLMGRDKVTIGKETKSLFEWEQISGVPFLIIKSRIKMKMSDEEILLPVRKKPFIFVNKMITIDNTTKTAKEWSEETGISIKTIISRMRYGWKDKDIILPPAKRKNITQNVAKD